MLRNMIKYSVLIVEDVYPAQELLKNFVSSRPELELKKIVATTKDLQEALNNDEFDLMLLDIHLKNKSSIEIIEEIENLPYIIFTTADIKFAHKALEIGAIDYLLKPFQKERFDEAIHKFLTIRENYTPFDMYRAIKKIEGDTKYKNSKLSEEKIDEYAKKIIEYVESTKAFKNPKISIQLITKDIGISPHNFSQVINQKLGKNFYEFINQYRIDEVKKLLNDPANQNKNLLDISCEAGFGSKSVFNSIFKEFEKISPSQYRKKIKGT